MRLLDPDLEPPQRTYAGDAGLDLRARISVTLSAAVRPVKVPTGIAVEVPAGHVGYVCPRSGLAAKYGIGILNAPGIIDSGYRGEIFVVLHSVIARARTIERGARIAQLVFAPIAVPSIQLVAALSVSARGAQGFGSSDETTG